MASKIQKRANLAAWPGHRERLEARGCAVRLMSEACWHWRVTTPTGVTGEFYSSTLVWVVSKPSVMKGVGVDSLLERLFDPRQPAPVGKQPGPNVTIFADASHDVDKKVAGWGGWMIRNGLEARTAGGIVETGAQTSFEAEVRAIALAVQDALGAGYIHSGDRVMIQSDCKSALECLLFVVLGAIDSPHPHGLSLTPVKRLRRNVRPPVDEVEEICRMYRLTLILRHVPGHRDGDGRAWVNRECDRIAKLHMKTARKKTGLAV